MAATVVKVRSPPTELHPLLTISSGVAVRTISVEGGQQDILENGEDGRFKVADGNLSRQALSLACLLDEPAIRDSMLTDQVHQEHSHFATGC